jgi:cellulose synthase/poly-beta-1,6-N-acetylglucosamine synthase-like glycosyltransferase
LLYFTIILLIYIFIGYPALLLLLAKLFPKAHKCDFSYQPSTTLVISAHNEEGVIGKKLENALALDYPKDRLKIIVVSDRSTDGTDDIVRSYQDAGIELLYTGTRGGKTAGLNLAMTRISTEIVVFSDANALYDRFAIKNLVRHFSDPFIGYVVGHAQYDYLSKNTAANSEHLYWNVEVKIKQLESDFSSVVGGDGAIYAIRRELYEPLMDSDINDFVNPLQIIVKGYRGIFDRAAWCSENPAEEFQKEFARKVRITNRSFNAVLRFPVACNPLKVGRFAWQLISHKLLRWFSPFIILLQYVLAFAAIREPVGVAIIVIYSVLAFVAFLGWTLRNNAKTPVLFYFSYYFVLMNVAMATGIILRLKGEVITIWDTVRERSAGNHQATGIVPFLLLGILSAGFIRICFLCGHGTLFLQMMALLAILGLFHTYLGYPIALGMLARIKPVRVLRDEHYLPEITLLILAYNEEEEIEAKLLNCLELDYPKDRIQILIASDGSTDATNRIVNKYINSQIQLLDFPTNRGKVAALNEAIQQVISEIVVFSDANVMLEPQAIKKMVRNFADPNVGTVSGKVKLLGDTISYREAEAFYYCIEHFIQAKESETGSMIGADGAMYAIRRELFLPPPDDTILDDFAISMAIACKGKLVLHEPEACGYEKNTKEIQGEFRRKARIIAGGIQCLLRGIGIPSVGQTLLAFKFVSHKLLRWFIGPITVALIFLLLCIELMAPQRIFSAALYGALGWLLLSIIGQFLRFARKVMPIAVCHYLMMLNIAAIVGCYLGFTGRQRVNWKSAGAI